MNAPRHSEAELRAMLAELYPTATPNYRDDILGRTSRARQRPGWTFLERWLPMTLTLRRPLLATPVWLLLGLMLVLALLAATLLVPILSRPTSLFSAASVPMSNGLIAYDRANDIYVVDPAGGDPRILIGGDEMDMVPVWSPDGMRIAFWRRVPESGVMVANADGSGAILVIPGAMEDQASPYFEWSPDSTQLLTDITDSDSTIRLVNVDGSGTRDLDVGMPVDFPVWHPDGRSILFRGWAEGDVTGLYTVDVETGRVAGPIVAADPSDPLFQRVGGEPFYFAARFSPDGSKILYSNTIDPLPGQDKEAWYYRLRVVDADGTDDHRVESSSTVRSEGWPAWSPDGTRFVAWVEPGSSRDLEYLAIEPLAADGDIVTTEPVVGGYEGWVWSPDGSKILAWGENHRSLIDTATGVATPFEMELGRSADWQPVAG